MKAGDPLQRQRLALEIRHKRAELALARRQLRQAEAQLEWESRQATKSGFRLLITPTGVVLVGAMLGLVGTAVGKFFDNRISRRELETSVILKASDVPATLSEDAQSVQRARNLLWFQRAGYITLERDRVEQLELEARIQPGQALPAPVVQAPATTAAGTGQRFNFLVLNQASINERGWDIDVFSCTADDAQAQAAREFAANLASYADRRQSLGGAQLGRIRFDASTDHRRPGNQIFFDANEAQVARMLEPLAEREGRAFEVIANPEAPTSFYLSVYFCQAS